MRNMRRRLQLLERLPQFQPPPSPLEQIKELALKQLSDEDLALMKDMIRGWDKRVCWALSPSESAAVTSHHAALDAEARRMGFQSYADAERRMAPRR
jgi:hypothetical protein